jgi:DNA polymerase (family 10)
VDWTSRDANFAVARLFEEIAQSLEVAGEQGHRQRAYRRAARSVASTSERVEDLAAQGRLRDIPGVGASIAALITEFLETGAMRTHQQLIDEHPPGLAPLLNARGFGPAGVQSLHAATSVNNLDDIERAAQDGSLARALGQRRADELLAQLPSLRNPIRSLRLKSAFEAARELLELINDIGPRPLRIAVAGGARRMCDSVNGGLDFVALPAPGQGSALLDVLGRLPNAVGAVSRSESSATARLYDGIEVRLHLAEPATWGAALLWHTGSAAHLDRLQRLAADRGLRLTPRGFINFDGATPVDLALAERPGDDEPPNTAGEAAIYARLGLPWLTPELREDSGEIEAAVAGSLPRLIEQADLRGDLHCHTHWTDGTASLEEMALAARASGYAYMALTDHSRSLPITNGLSLERLEEARRQVQQLNARLAPFSVLLGTEMDILEDGALDYPDETLRTLDYVSASVHNRFKQTHDLMTARILRAVGNPLVNTLNHPHGRLLGFRPAYAVDMPAVIAAAARGGCALEVSADPARMDLDGGWARQVREAGGRCTISSDAHSTLDFDNIWLAIGSARRGWLEAQHVLNTRPLAELKALLRARS